MSTLRTRILGAGLPLILLLASGPALGQERTGTYGNTPEEMHPYRGFQAPYKLFFADVQPFLGAGRDKAPPAGLTSVKLGFFGPLEEGAPEAELGQRMLRGTQLAIEEANARGGYRGLPYELVVRDDVGAWGASSNVIMEMEEEKVWGVLGSIDGTSTHIALRVALKLGLPIVTSGGTDPTLTETRIPWLVRVIADDRQNGYALATRLFRENEYRRIIAVRANNRYGRMGIKEFSDAARRMGHPLLLEMRYAPGETDFAALLDRLERTAGEAIVFWGDAEEAGRFVRQLRERGLEHPVFGSDRLVAEAFLREAGPHANGVVATYPYNPDLDDPVLQEFNRRYEARFGEAPEAFAAHAFDGMSLLIEGVESAGLNRVRIQDALYARPFYRGVTGDILFDPTFSDVGPVWLAEVRDGRFEFFPPRP